MREIRCETRHSNLNVQKALFYLINTAFYINTVLY